MPQQNKLNIRPQLPGSKYIETIDGNTYIAEARNAKVAADIVTRWNAYDDLVAALRDAIDVMDVHDASHWAIDAARAALAKATA